MKDKMKLNKNKLKKSKNVSQNKKRNQKMSN